MKRRDLVRHLRNEGCQRDGFITRFWRARDPVTRTEHNELKEDWYARLGEARELYGRLDDARSFGS